MMCDSFIKGDEIIALPVISSRQIKNGGFQIKKKKDAKTNSLLLINLHTEGILQAIFLPAIKKSTNTTA